MQWGKQIRYSENKCDKRQTIKLVLDFLEINWRFDWLTY